MPCTRTPFRGLALAAFSHWWGWRRGWTAARLAFGCVHLLNLSAAFQFFNTMLPGSVFLLAAVATRSLFWPALGHALYHWAAIDTARRLHFFLAIGCSVPLRSRWSAPLAGLKAGLPLPPKTRAPSLVMRFVFFEH